MSFLSKLFLHINNFVLTEEYKRCLDLLENTNENLFITGKAGTGKTTLIQYFRQHTKKKVVVLAPTGIAALNIHGQTIHSFFKFPPRMINLNAIKKINNDRLYADIDCIVIDEISMVRSDVLDGIDRFLRLHGKDHNLPFGGVQMVLVGDLYQLPPVVTYEEMPVFAKIYDSPFFFSSQAFQSSQFHLIELQTIFRQQETEFIEVLNRIREGNVSLESLQLINERQLAKTDQAHITLCATNKIAEGINQHKLSAINKPIFTYSARVEGIFPTEERNLPVDLELKLKQGASVLFVKNDPEGQWANGSRGVVDKINPDRIQVRLDGGKVVEAHIDTWENIKYQYDETTGEIKSEVVGKLMQYPLKLAWAITIHKSQGMSFDKVCLDFTHSPFAHGQTYVALSRCRTLKGLVLTKKIWPNDILIDERISEFYSKIGRQIT